MLGVILRVVVCEPDVERQRALNIVSCLLYSYMSLTCKIQNQGLEQELPFSVTSCVYVCLVAHGLCPFALCIHLRDMLTDIFEIMRRLVRNIQAQRKAGVQSPHTQTHVDPCSNISAKKTVHSLETNESSLSQANCKKHVAPLWYLILMTVAKCYEQSN